MHGYSSNDTYCKVAILSYHAKQDKSGLQDIHISLFSYKYIFVAHSAILNYSCKGILYFLLDSCKRWLCQSIVIAVVDKLHLSSYTKCSCHLEEIQTCGYHGESLLELIAYLFLFIKHIGKHLYFFGVETSFKVCFSANL